MKKLLLLSVVLASNAVAEPLLIVPAYPDPTGFYEHYHCTGASLYDICPTRLVVNLHIEHAPIEPPKQIHLPRTDTRAQMRKLEPGEDIRYSYRVQ